MGCSLIPLHTHTHAGMGTLQLTRFRGAINLRFLTMGEPEHFKLKATHLRLRAVLKWTQSVTGHQVRWLYCTSKNSVTRKKMFEDKKEWME